MARQGSKGGSLEAWIDFGGSADGWQWPARLRRRTITQNTNVGTVYNTTGVEETTEGDEMGGMTVVATLINQQGVVQPRSMASGPMEPSAWAAGSTG